MGSVCVFVSLCVFLHTHTRVRVVLLSGFLGAVDRPVEPATGTQRPRLTLETTPALTAILTVWSMLTL